MGKKILINARTSGETRVVVLDNNELTDFDSEISTKRPIKGNVYLAKVVRVEPSLQAVFIEYGNERNGFLPFSEIHPDYYRIPVADRNILEADDSGIETMLQEDPQTDISVEDMYLYPDSVGAEVSTPSAKQGDSSSTSRKKHYNVQEVIQHKQILLVQAIKDERGNKGAAFTTYLSLPGQYCVLMPNAGNRSGGVSKRIQEDDTRKRLKDVLKDLKIPEKMSAIIRTAGQERTKVEIRRDYEYLSRVWEDIRQKTLESNAPALIHEEADICMRAIRDFYTKDVTEIIVDDSDAYKQTRAIMKQLSPSGVKKITWYKDASISLFNLYDIENQILSLISPRVELPSGGSIVIGQTEALVAIDVNSGKSTRERHIDATAVKTNLEAAKEIARQLRLRDLSGLIVIDFIDMNDPKYIHQIEKCFKEEIETDRARVQVASISQFCLLELSRQRLRTSVMETYSEVCSHCQGRGVMYSSKYFLSTILHLLEKTASKGDGSPVIIYTPLHIYGILLNEKRQEICTIENNYHCTVQINLDPHLADCDFVIDDGLGTPTLFSLGKTIEDSEEIDLEDDFKEKTPSIENTNTDQASPKKEGRKRRPRRRNAGVKNGEQEEQGEQSALNEKSKQPQPTANFMTSDKLHKEDENQKANDSHLQKSRKNHDSHRRNRNRRPRSENNQSSVKKPASITSSEVALAEQRLAKEGQQQPKAKLEQHTHKKNETATHSAKSETKKKESWLKKIFNSNDEK